MNQSTVIFAYLFFAFLIFITQRGELDIYWGFLTRAPQGPATNNTATTTAQTIISIGKALATGAG